uniref:Ataxin-2 C-terminal domain-containing protein n=1 Tax=Anopheles epiroticus TaxID=199890 RepID=A0A182P4F2_9DIPT
MEINGAASNGFLAENTANGMEDHKAYDDIQSFMVESAMLEPKSAASTLCVGPMDDMGFLSDGGLGPETDVDGTHDSKQQSPSPLLEEAVKSAELLDNGDIEQAMANVVDSVVAEPHHTMDHHNPFAASLNSPLDLPGEANTTDFEEEEPTSPSSVSAADPVDLSEQEHQQQEGQDHLVHAVPHVNGNGEHHYDEVMGEEAPTTGDDELLVGAPDKLDAEIVPALKAELNADEIVPLKAVDEPSVNELLGADAIVDNKLIDQLDSFGLPEAIRRQLIEQQVTTGGAMLHEQDEDDDEGQLMAEERKSDFDGVDDGAEKEDLHHEKVFDSDYGTDHHSADVKQDDDAGCCEDSEEDEWDYVKVNSQEQQQQQLHEQESQAEPEKQPEESTPLDESTHTVEYSSNSFAPEEPLQQEEDNVQQRVQELEQHFEQQHQLQTDEDEVVKYEEEQQQQQQVEQTPAPDQKEEHVEVKEEEEDREAQHHDEAAVPNTSESVVADILGDYAESTVSESAKEVDDVISTGGETKEVVNLLNDFKEDVLPPTAADTVCDTTSETLNEEPFEASEPAFVPSDSANMEASMYGGSIGEQQLSPESPMSPGENFPGQQQHEQYSHEKNMFGSDMDDTMSPSGDGEELNEKHLYEAEEKSMNLQQQQEGSGAAMDYGWQLNPEAKEFVPVSGPVGGEMNAKLHENIKMRDDAIVSQSPRKGTMSSMEDLDVPAEKVFQTEMDKRPHEFEEYGGENGANDSTGEPTMVVHPFDLSQFNEQTVVEQQLVGATDLANGVGDYLAQDNNPQGDLMQQNGSDVGTDELELLNKVQELPDDEEDKVQEQAVEVKQQEPVQSYAEEFEQVGKSDEVYSAKEELSVEQKETVDISSASAELARELDNLMLEGGEMYHVNVNEFPPEQVPKSMVSDISQSPEFKMLESSVPHVNFGSTSKSASAAGAAELAAYQQQASALEGSVYDPEPERVSAQETNGQQASQNNVDLLGAVEQKTDAEPLAEAAPQQDVELPAEPQQPQEANDEKKTEEPKATEIEKEVVEVSATAAAATVAATVAVAAAAATAATVAATSKPASKPKAPSSTTTATKKPATSAKPSSAVAKDSTAKSVASRVGGTTTSAARKPLAKAPASSSGPAARSTTVKSSTDAAKVAATKTTASSVAAARTKAASATSTTKTATSASSTTKSASASSVTRTAATKPATGSAVTKTTSRLSTATSSSTTTTTRTVTSRPSSAVSSASVPSKASTTTTTTAKRTVAAKSSLTNGTTTTDGTSTKTTKTTTTTSSTGPRTGATRTTAGVGTKTSSSSTTAAARKPTLDTKTTANKTASSTTAGRTTTTTRTSLAPKAATTGATSPSVRKVQQNGVAAKKSTASAVSPAAGTKKPAPITRPKSTAATTTTAAAAPAVAKTNGTVHEEVADPVATTVSSPLPEQPEQQQQPAADQLLVPVPQAM